MSNGLKLMLLCAGTLITCIVVTLAIHMARVSRQTGEKYNEHLNSFYEDLDSSSITTYDGVEVYGSDVVNFIKKQLGDYSESESSPLTITVVTSLSPRTEYSYTNRAYVSEIQNFTNVRYINPLHLFCGEVVYNGNDVITQIIFTIQ